MLATIVQPEVFSEAKNAAVHPSGVGKSSTGLLGWG